MRTFVERTLRGVYFKRRLPKRYGYTAIFVSPDSQLKYLLPGEKGFDSNLLRIVDEQVKANSIIWDIGANIGVFGFAAAKVASEGSVLAVEADIWLANLLVRSTRIPANNKLNIDILPAAITDNSGVASFLIAERGRASNALETSGGRSQMGGVRQKVLVPTLTLDCLLESRDRPTFVKIDVEGAEIDVLKGATKLLRQIRPTIYIEVGKEQTNDATHLLKDAGYILYDGEFPLAGQRPRENCVENTLAIPK